MTTSASFDKPELVPVDRAARPARAAGTSVGELTAQAVEKAKASVAARYALLHEQHKGWFDRVEAFISMLSVRETFWHRVCSLIWLPLAFFSGIRMKSMDANTFSAYLPFSRFNRNWYRAMAGGALLANSEIAGGMYVFGLCGADYTVVCKHLEYTFLRPCFGPAIYRMTPREDLKALIETKGEFNVTLDLEVSQQGFRAGERDKKVGRAVATFHATPKIHHKLQKLRQRGEV